MIPDYKCYNLERRGWQQVKKNDYYTSYRRGNVLVIVRPYATHILMRDTRDASSVSEAVRMANTIILPVMDMDAALDYAERLPYNFENS